MKEVTASDTGKHGHVVLRRDLGPRWPVLLMSSPDEVARCRRSKGERRLGARGASGTIVSESLPSIELASARSTCSGSVAASKCGSVRRCRLSIAVAPSRGRTTGKQC